MSVHVTVHVVTKAALVPVNAGVTLRSSAVPDATAVGVPVVASVATVLFAITLV